MADRADPGFTDAERAAAARLVDAALDEDLSIGGDVTTQLLIPADARVCVCVVARQQGVLAGLGLLKMVYEALGAPVAIDERAADGEALVPGQCAAVLRGPTAPLLTGERTALNFLTHLSGVATLTRRFVEAAAAAGGRAQILDTRKTLPGWRALQKYAVRCGGGQNHRMGLYDGVLIKDNHLAAWMAREAVVPAAALAQAVAHARRNAPAGMPIEIEVDSLEQLDDVLSSAPDIVLLDNFRVERLREAVARRDRVSPNTQLEASGGVTLETVAAIAASGVDRISVGALTHSAPALDLAFDWHAEA